nr:hypothetical protein [Tanacetum cinerariifolium]
MSRDVLTVGSTMRILLLYRGEYSQWVERFMNYLEEQTGWETMINLIKNGDQPLPRVTQVSIAGTSSTEQPHLKDKSMWSDQDKRLQKIDRLARSLLIQELPNDIYSLIDSNKTAKDLWDALARRMLGSEYGEQDRKAVILYEYETFKATERELFLDTYIRYLQVINDLKKCGYSKDNYELNFKFLNNLQLEWKQYATMMRQNKNLMDINIDALYNVLKQNQGDVNDAMGSKKKLLWDLIFESQSGLGLNHLKMETLTPTLMVSAYVIDVWAELLNILEIYKDESLPLRYFFKITVYIPVFFPVCHGDHIYLICVDFNKGSIHLIDNSANGTVHKNQKYKGIPQAIFLYTISVTLLIHNIWNSMCAYPNIVGKLATEAAENSSQVAKLRSAHESIDHKRRKAGDGGVLWRCGGAGGSDGDVVPVLWCVYFVKSGIVRGCTPLLVVYSCSSLEAGDGGVLRHCGGGGGSDGDVVPVLWCVYFCKSGIVRWCTPLLVVYSGYSLEVWSGCRSSPTVTKRFLWGGGSSPTVINEAIQSEYCAREEIQRLEIEFWYHTMEGSEIEAYTTRFNELASLCLVMAMPETRRIEMYLKGLAPAIHSLVTTSNPPTSRQQYWDDNNSGESNKNQISSHQGHQSAKRNGSGKDGNINNSSGSNKNYHRNNPRCNKCGYYHMGDYGNIKCRACGKQGHIAKNYPQNNQNTISNNSGKPKKCFKCDKEGHIKKDCPELDKANGNSSGNTTATQTQLKGKHSSWEQRSTVGRNLLPIEQNEALIVRGERVGFVIGNISYMKAEKIIRKGREAVLAVLTETETGEPKLEDIPVVREFPEVFSKELPRLPP